MHNLLSTAQLIGWRRFEKTVDQAEDDTQRLNDYYECLIECDVTDSHSCKRICRRLLMN
jgi:hypothetical protein